jgi:RNA polymerase sigma-70 factor (ECF subfamily)
VNNLEVERLQLAIQGNQEAFTELVETYQTPVYNLCYRMLGDPQEAEDAAQETFWRAYQALDRYDQQRSFITWLLSIAAHYCIDQQRRRKMTSVPMDDVFEEILPDGAPSPESAVSRSEEEIRLHKLLNKLGSQDRAAVILRYWYDMSEQEIAQSLSLSISAVKSRLFRARQQLAKSWQTTQPEIRSSERSRHETPAL